MSRRTKEMDWATFKTRVDAGGLRVEYDVIKRNLGGSEQEFYDIWAGDQLTIFTCGIKKENPTVDPSDQKVFEDDYLPMANTVNPLTVDPIAGSTVILDGDAVSGSIPKGSAVDIDFGPIGEQRLLKGGHLITDKSVMGDWVKFQVIDIDDVLGQGAGFVVATFIKKWFVPPTGMIQFETPQASKIFAGLYIRCTYTSVGTVNNVTAGINYLLLKQLS
jgi:hypothetical protein